MRNFVGMIGTPERECSLGGNGCSSCAIDPWSRPDCGHRDHIQLASRTAASDVSCDRYAWPNYPAECLTSEDGVAATKTGRRIVPGGSDPRGSEVRIVVARQQGVAPIAAADVTAPRPANLVEISGEGNSVRSIRRECARSACQRRSAAEPLKPGLRAERETSR